MPGGLLKSGNDNAAMKIGERQAMKLYDSIGPNPHIVRMFMAEKGIDMPKQTVDLRSGENREARASQAQPARPDADARTR